MPLPITTIPTEVAQAARANVNSIESNWKGLVEQGLDDANTELETQQAEIETIQNILPGFSPLRYGLSASVDAGILTIALKDGDGNDPSADSPVVIPFRDATLASGDSVRLTIASPLSIDTNATGATLGTQNSFAFRLWVLLFNNGGTPVFGLYQTVGLTSTSPYANLITSLAALSAQGVLSTTPISAAATSAGVVYTPNGTTLTSKAYRVLGYVEYSAGLATAGTYASLPTEIQLYGPDIKLPGDVVQTNMARITSLVSTSALTPAFDDTIPQITEGAEFLSNTITPAMAPNIIHVEVIVPFLGSDTGNNGTVFICRGGVNNCLACTGNFLFAGAQVSSYVDAWDLPNGVSSITYSSRFSGVTGGGTTFINGRAAATRRYGGASYPTLKITEIMA